MRRLMHLLSRLQRRDPPPVTPVDRAAKRFEMTQRDPDFAHVREVYHDANIILAGKQAAEQLWLRRERQFWQQRGQGR